MTLLTPILIIVLIQLSKIVMLFNLSRGFGVPKVNGFNLLPKPAHNINAVLIFI
jgi:hypothetical protein